MFIRQLAKSMGLYAFGLTACLKGPLFMEQQGNTMLKSKRTANSQQVIAKRDEHGAEIASIKPGLNVPQEIKVSETSPVAGTVVSFPPGSLAVETEIRIEEAVPVATSGVSAELGIGDAIGSTGKAVSVQPTVATDPVQPFTVAINLPPTANLAPSELNNLVVVYKVRMVAEGKVVAGVIARKDLEISGQTVRFLTNFFGAFQAALTKVEIPESKQVSVVMPIQTKKDVATLPSISISSRTPFVVSPGRRVEITGTNFRPTMMIALGGNKVADLKLLSDVKASFVVPAYDGYGLANLTADQDGVSQTIHLFYTGSKSDFPVITLAESDVCKDQKFYDASGILRIGSKICSQPDLTHLTPGNIKAGVTIANIVGTYSAPALADCSVDGEIDCKAVLAFKAADMSKVTSSNIRAGVTLAGIAGSLMPAPTNCSTDGAINCVATPSYKAAKISNFSESDIKAGVTIAGVAGSLANCSLDGGTSCVAVSAYPAAKISQFVPSDLKSGITVAGIAGTLGNCTGNAQTNCVATATFKSADLSNLTPGNIKSGITIAGQTGAYPSSTYPLLGADSVADLNLASFDAKVKNAASFEWFDSAGTRYENSGDADIVSGNIVQGVTIFGATGSIPTCTADNQTGCVTTARYKSMDTDPSVISPWDIRLGKTVGGLAGELKYCKSSARTARFDYTTLPGISGLDRFDTIDDLNGGAAGIPNEIPFVSDTCSASNWAAGGSDSGATSGFCNDTADECVYQDKLTGLSWSERAPGGTSVFTTYTWADALTACSTMNTFHSGAGFGGFNDWRLPTLKEMLQAAIDGIKLADSSTYNYFNNTYTYWSATTDSMTTTNAWYLNLATGSATTFSKTGSKYALCVRP